MADAAPAVKQEPLPQRESTGGQNAAQGSAGAENGGGNNNRPQNGQNKNRRGNFRGGRGGGPGVNRSFAARGQNPQANPRGFNNKQGGGPMKQNDNGPGHHVGSANEVGERRHNFKKNEDHLIFQKLGQFVGPTYDLQPISQEEIKFSNRNRLYVGNLTNDVTENDLKELFAPFGEIAETFINKEKNFAFVKVDFRPNAEKAKRELDGVVRKGRNIRIRFAPNATCIKVRNLDTYVSNELLYRTFEIFGPVERAVIIVDDRGKSTGEGIVEFARKNSALSAIRFCGERCLFLTASLKPAVVEAYDLIDDTDGFPEKSIMNRKNNDFLKARETGPRFADQGSFEHEYGTRWKQLHERFAQKKEALKRELANDIEKLDAQGEYARYEHETEMLREQLRQREQDRDRQKMEWEMKERNADEQRTREEEMMRRTNEDMQMKMHRQEEELLRRQQENTLFMQAQQLESILDQQERKNFDYTRRGDHFEMPPQEMNIQAGGGSGGGGGGGGGNQFNRQSRFDDQPQHPQQHQQHPQQHPHHGGGGGGGIGNHQGGGGGGPMRNMQRQWDRRDDNFANKRRRF